MEQGEGGVHPGARAAAAVVLSGHLVVVTTEAHDGSVSEEAPLDWETTNDLIGLLMRIEANVDEILDLLEEEDDGEEEEANS